MKKKIVVFICTVMAAATISITGCGAHSNASSSGKTAAQTVSQTSQNEDTSTKDSESPKAQLTRKNTSVKMTDSAGNEITPESILKVFNAAKASGLFSMDELEKKSEEIMKLGEQRINSEKERLAVFDKISAILNEIQQKMAAQGNAK